jgi:hydroxyacylglutathione hydrolase
MRVVPVPCLSDNYAYLLVPDGSKKAIVVDPSEADPIVSALDKEGLELVAIVDTHHHPDHVGGNSELVAKYKVPVYAHASDDGRIPALTNKVEEGTPFTIEGLEFSVLHVPGHTTGAVTYVVEGCAFTGDTLFVGGCGRLFEGTPAMMNVSLNDKLAKLPAETKVYCGHEYTVSNLKFAIHAEPDNQAAKDKLARSEGKRQKGEPTVPSTMGEELATNPFLRVNQPSLAARYGGGSPSEVLAAVRKAKDTFKA